jgi:hypothetical protein
MLINVVHYLKDIKAIGLKLGYVIEYMGRDADLNSYLISD